MTPGMHTRLISCLIASTLLMTATVIAQELETIADIPVNPLSISGLREFAQTVSAEFKTEYERQALEGIQRRVVSYDVDGLRQYALILEPSGKVPAQGWPVLLMNHGHQPAPIRPYSKW